MYDGEENSEQTVTDLPGKPLFNLSSVHQNIGFVVEVLHERELSDTCHSVVVGIIATFLVIENPIDLVLLLRIQKATCICTSKENRDDFSVESEKAWVCTGFVQRKNSVC